MMNLYASCAIVSQEQPKPHSDSTLPANILKMIDGIVSSIEEDDLELLAELMNLSIDTSMLNSGKEVVRKIVIEACSPIYGNPNFSKFALYAFEDVFDDLDAILSTDLVNDLRYTIHPN